MPVAIALGLIFGVLVARSCNRDKSIPVKNIVVKEITIVVEQKSYSCKEKK